MGVYIKGMKMPTGCDDCEFCKRAISGYDWCCVPMTNGRDKPLDEPVITPEWCPLVPVPSHGRLIDGDAFEEFIRKDWDKNDHWIAEVVYSRPTIIPAEEKEENYCADCHWYEPEQQYCFRNGCHAYNESSCELWEPMPADEPIPAPGGKTVPTTYDLLYEEGGPDTR